MKIQTPRFSERYMAHVEAERQYVLNTQQEDTPASQGHAERSQKNAGVTTPSIEDAFRSARMENKNNNPNSSPRKTTTQS